MRIGVVLVGYPCLLQQFPQLSKESLQNRAAQCRTASRVIDKYSFVFCLPEDGQHFDIAKMVPLPYIPTENRHDLLLVQMRARIVVDETFQDFVAIIRALHKRRKDTGPEDEYLLAVQIASIVKMNSGRKVFDQSIVSRVIAQYSTYFPSIRRKKYPEYTVDWELVTRDHPSILPSGSNARQDVRQTGTPGYLAKPQSQVTPRTVSATSRGYSQKPKSLSEFCENARRALADEYRQAEEILLSHPVIVKFFRPIDQPSNPAATTLDPGIARIYEADLEYRIDEAPPIPEGVPVRVRWQYPSGLLAAKLLQWDLLNSKVYLAFERPLDDVQRHNQSRIELTTHELLKPLAANLDAIKTIDELVLWKLLSNAQPKRLFIGRKEVAAKLDESQIRAVRKAIENDYSIIWGPPGTGKTHTIGCLICELVQAGKRVLASSISNVAVDNMAIKFVANMFTTYPALQQDYKSGRFLRFGYTKNDELSDGKYRPLFSIQSEMADLLQQIGALRRDIARLSRAAPKEAAKLRDDLDKLEQQRMDLSKRMVANAKVVFTTAAQVYINSAFELLHDYDVAIIDEVSMMAVPTFSVVAARSRAQTVVVGDFRQLAPIAVSQSAISHQYLHKSPFEWLDLHVKPDHPGMEMLNTQRRMGPSISGWISSQYYQGNLQDDAVVLRDYVVELPSQLPSQLVCWDISKSRHKTARYSTQFSDRHSRFNIGSGECVERLATRLKILNPGATIAIITTYREQAFIIRRNLEEWIAEHSTDIHVGTVHTFQGSEADIVIWDTVDTAEVGLGQPYKGDQGNRLTNVAVSRARKQMIVACDRGILRKVSAQATAGKFMDLLRDLESCERTIDSWLD